MRRELEGQLVLSPEEEALLDKHSLLNLCNILEMQLTRLAERVSRKSIRPFTRSCLQLIMEMPRIEMEDLLPAMERHCLEVEQFLQGLLGEHPAEEPLIRALLETLALGQARIEEFKGNRFAWREISRSEFPKTLLQFLRTSEQVSDGRFRFSFAPEPPEPSTYWVDFQIDSPHESIRAPCVLHDTIRDLAGNARKYSKPDGKIRIELKSLGKQGLRLRVADEGMGIPEEEIEKVIQFGYRGSNALDKRTMGGGFGLTKAYSLCKRFNGRFFIESEAGKGTAIELTLMPPS